MSWKVFRKGTSDRQPDAAVVILGMHRSGTSSLAGSLEACGLYLGEVSQYNRHNTKGNREHRFVISLNDQLLTANGGSWDRPPETMVWDQEMAAQRDAWVRRQRQPDRSRWGFKDPRTLLTLPFWLEGLAHVQLVGTYRHPDSVVKSLASRGSIDVVQGMFLWRFYNRKLLETWDRTPFPIVSFDANAEQYRDSLKKLARYLQLPDCEDGNDFFESSLRHQEHGHAEEFMEDEDRRIYERLEVIYRSNWDD